MVVRAHTFLQITSGQMALCGSGGKTNCEKESWEERKATNSPQDNGYSLSVKVGHSCKENV